MSNPTQIISKIMHREDNVLDNWPSYEVGLIAEKCTIHIEKCQHPRCIDIKGKDE